MMHPHTELRFINDQIGYGVVATKLIPKGTITWALDDLDRSFTPQQFNQMKPLYKDILEKYCYRDNQGRYVLCWDISRFVNHSFKSSCISTAYEFELAIRDIQPGEEITNDYGYLNITEPFDVVPEPHTDRTTVYPDDLLRYHDVWDAQLLEAFKNFEKVDQPLQSIIKQEYFSKALLVARNEEKMDSILNCYFDEAKIKAQAGNGSY